jgi:hypothetical protein
MLLANSGQVTGIISLVALSFMVQLPVMLVQRQVLVIAELSDIAQHAGFAVVGVKHPGTSKKSLWCDAEIRPESGSRYYSNRLTTGTVWPGWQDDSSMWNGWWSRRRNARWFSNGGCA